MLPQIAPLHTMVLYKDYLSRDTHALVEFLLSFQRQASYRLRGKLNLADLDGAGHRGCLARSRTVRDILSVTSPSRSTEWTCADLVAAGGATAVIDLGDRLADDGCTDARSGPTLHGRTDPLHTRAKSTRSSVVTDHSCPTTTNDSSQQQQTYGMIQLNGRSRHVGTHVFCEIRLCLSASMMVSMIISAVGDFCRGHSFASSLASEA